MPVQTIKISDLIPMLENEKSGTLREAFPGERPDFVQEFDKLCTGVTMKRKDDPVGFSVSFVPPIQLEAGVGYVFEERT